MDNLAPSPDQTAQSGSTRQVFSVSQLNAQVRSYLELEFPRVWVEGELSRIKPHSSGHLYFSLKDDGAAIDCAMFRNQNRLLRFKPTEGQQVLLRGKVTLYEPYGRFQFVVEHMEESGEGALRRAYEALRQKLQAAGWFDATRKRALPTLPQRIGIVTSDSGAAIHDLLSVLGRRFPGIPLRLFPAPVQGKASAPQLAEMIRHASTQGDCDVLIVGRGGGSLEDLWAFNEELVLQAIFDSPVPIVSAVGHESDTTLADFVADLRAATPSAAAELVAPDAQALLRRIEHPLLQMQRQLTSRLQHAQLKLDHLDTRVQQSLKQGLQQRGHQLSALQAKLRSPQQQLRNQRQRLEQLMLRMQQQWRPNWSSNHQHSVHELQRRLDSGIHLRIANAQQRWKHLTQSLEQVSPLSTLARGYAVALDTEGKPVTSIQQVKIEQSIRVRLRDGSLSAKIIEKDASKT
jgi:exodeoxyribonuclease VII large subunit